MNKTFLTAIVIIILSGALTYGLFAFSAWELNAGNWTEWQRMFCSLLWVAASVISIAYYRVEKKQSFTQYKTETNE